MKYPNLFVASTSKPGELEIDSPIGPLTSPVPGSTQYTRPSEAVVYTVSTAPVYTVRTTKVIAATRVIVPPPVVTDTSTTLPLTPAGATAVTWVSESTVKL